MRRPVIKAIIKMCAQSILLALVVGIVIGVIGYFNQWHAPITYSNAFFIAGAVFIIAGASSRFAAGQQIGVFRALNSESFRKMSSGERIDYIVNINSPIRTVILGLLTGILLMIVSAIAAKMS